MNHDERLMEKKGLGCILSELLAPEGSPCMLRWGDEDGKLPLWFVWCVYWFVVTMSMYLGLALALLVAWFLELGSG